MSRACRFSLTSTRDLLRREASPGVPDALAILMRARIRRLVGDSGIVLRVGRYGPYLGQGRPNAQCPGDLAPDELTPEKRRELAQPFGDRELESTQQATAIIAKSGRYGPYVTELLPEDEPAAEADPDAASAKKRPRSPRSSHAPRARTQRHEPRHR